MEPNLSKLRALWPLCLLAVAATAWAGDPGAQAGAAAKAAAARAAARSQAAETEDPMDPLRRKLADKLAAVRSPASLSPYELRIPNRAAAGDEKLVHAAPSVAARSAAARSAEAPHEAHWDYSGTYGPEAWGRMKPEYAKCASGERQSPIDIRGGIRVNQEPVQFDYRASGFSVIDNGHTVQVNVGPGNTIAVMGRRYELLQFHFHRPSEERIDGRQFDMVAHLVHKDPEGRLAVVAVLLDRGSAQPLVQAVWNNLPLEKGESQAAAGTLDLTQLLPDDRRYYAYMGSLTTPPCSENVLWMVMKKPVAVSAEQIAIFSRLYPMNARPIQSAAGRLIKESE